MVTDDVLETLQKHETEDVVLFGVERYASLISSFLEYDHRKTDRLFL